LYFIVFSFHISLVSKKNTKKKFLLKNILKKKGGIHEEIHFIGILWSKKDREFIPRKESSALLPLTYVAVQPQYINDALRRNNTSQHEKFFSSNTSVAINSLFAHLDLKLYKTRTSKTIFWWIVMNTPKMISCCERTMVENQQTQIIYFLNWPLETSFKLFCGKPS